MIQHSALHRSRTCSRQGDSRTVKSILALTIFTICPFGTVALAEERPMNAVDIIADRAAAEWVDGATTRALDILDQGLQAHPQALVLHKLRGDVLATSRRDQEAIEAYETVLRKTPTALGVRWAKWSVLLRSGYGDQAIAEFQRIAELDRANPLVPLRLARELRKLDRLEESVGWYKQAVELVPDMPGWRLDMARAQFDILDGRGARDEVIRVLKMVNRGSPEEMAARNLLSVVYGATKERGRRYQPIFSPEGTAAERKEWAFIRPESWRLVEAGRYEEAVPLLRRVLALKPSDFRATHDLGRALMGLGRCQEAVDVFERMAGMDPSDEVYADTFFRIARCLMKLEKWSEALLHFQILYEAAVEFELSTKDVPLQGGLTILDKDKLAKWIVEVKKHLPAENGTNGNTNELMPLPDPKTLGVMTEDEFYRQLAKKKLKTEDPIFTRAALMGRDADFSMFRYVIPASRVMRDDLPGGAHDFIPIDPHDTFPPTQEEIYLVFGLVTASYDEVPLTAQCFLEKPRITKDEKPLAHDRIVMGMSEQTGYFILSRPETGWTPGLHRCGLFVGHEVSAYTHADEVRFRIMESAPSS